MKNALRVAQTIHDEYAQLTGRTYGDGLLESYQLNDADVALICLGSTAGTVKAVVDDLREKGVKAGLLRIRTYRPFPAEAIVKALAKVKAVAVMDKSISFGGGGGAIFHEIRHALYDSSNRPFVVDYIYGLGGRDTSPAQILQIFDDLQKILKTKHVGDVMHYLGLRE
jgi:pyruvate ferredoxin oxidoreductase alpha subunit